MPAFAPSALQPFVVEHVPVLVSRRPGRFETTDWAVRADGNSAPVHVVEEHNPVADAWALF